MRKAPDTLREMRILRRIALGHGEKICGPPVHIDELTPIYARVEKIIAITNQSEKNTGDMTYFVMYDIASNKVRRLVAKYLERMGLTRVQKSIFMGNTDQRVYERIRTDMSEVQAAYDNSDSVMVVPVTADMTRAMHIIGRNLDIDVITRSKRTIFF